MTKVLPPAIGASGLPDAGERRKAGALLLRIVRDYPYTVPTVPPELQQAMCIMSEYHRVSPMLARATGDVDAGVLPRFRQLVGVRGAFVKAQVRRDLSWCASVLDGLPLGMIVLKGPALESLYEHGARDYRDLDLLVDGRSLQEAVERLTSAGATLVDLNFELMRQTVTGELTLLLPAGTVLDLHWHPLHSQRIRRHFSVDVRDLMTRSELRHISGVEDPVRVLSAVDSLWYSALHACLSGNERLSWMKDLQLIAKRPGFDADELINRSVRSRTDLPVALALERANRLTGAPVWSAANRLESGNRSWVAGSRWLTRVFPPELQCRKRPDRLFFRSTRPTSLASAREAAAMSVGDLLLKNRADDAHPWRRYRGLGQNALHLDRDDGSRSEFFAEVSRAATAT